MSDWNDQVIAEFRANGGKVGGQFDGADLVLLHHVGRKSGDSYIAPLVYFTDGDDASTIYVVASAAGAPKHPQWYENVTAAGTTTIELGTGTEQVRVEDLQGAERDRVITDIKAEAPGFGDYEKKTEGIRTIPVLALHRAG